MGTSQGVHTIQLVPNPYGSGSVQRLLSPVAMGACHLAR